MLSSLVAGLVPSGSGSWVNGSSTDEHPSSRAGVVLRREQVKLVLFEGKSRAGELDSGGDHPGTCPPSHHISIHSERRPLAQMTTTS